MFVSPIQFGCGAIAALMLGHACCIAQAASPVADTSSGVVRDSQLSDVKLTNPLLAAPSAVLDTWDSGQGPYGPDRFGPTPIYQLGAVVPAPALPQGLGDHRGDLLDWPAGTIVIDDDILCDRLVIPAGRLVQVTGDVTIHAVELFELGPDVKLEVAENATLRVVTESECNLGVGVRLNVEGDAAHRLRLHHLGKSDLHLPDGGELHARVIVPSARFILRPAAQFYGGFAGWALWVGPQAGVHIDTAAEPLDVVLATASYD